MQNYQKLEKKFKRLSHLGHLGSIVHWDQAVMMPEGGGESRAEAVAELSVMAHELMTSPELGDLLNNAEQAELSSLNEWQSANLREMQRSYKEAVAVDANLVEAKSIAGAKCENAWRTLRAENNWKDYLPLWKEVVGLVREEADQRTAATGLSRYDALLDTYEPGERSEVLDGLFEELKSFLPNFVQEVAEKQKSEEVLMPKGPFPIEKQRELGLEMMKLMGFDFKRGRLDVSHHPFCGGVPQDVRITTRYSEEDFTEALMGVLHETGHARYEQGLPAEWLNQPVGRARGMGFHESQSLLFEMQVSRSREFLNYTSAIIAKHLQTAEHGDKEWSAENLFKLNTRVQPGFIRVNADEVTYPMHVILRYEIERALVEEEMEPDEVPEAWDQKMKAYLGLSTKDNYKDGCMQDVHWTDGAMGYFPTYTLGAMNAAQLYACAKRDDSTIPSSLSKGEVKPLESWLREKVWRCGSYHSTDELMKQATGEVLNPKYFEKHLKNRYLLGKH